MTMNQLVRRTGGKLDSPAKIDAPSTMAGAQPITHPTVRQRRGPTVSWYGRLLIAGALLVGAGWEIFRLLLTFITLD